PLAQAGWRDGAAGQGGEDGVGIVLGQRPRAGVVDPQLVAGLLALGPVLLVRAADQLDRTGLPHVHVERDGVVASRGIAGQREGVTGALPQDRLDLRDLLQAPAGTPVQAVAYLEGSLHV